MRSYTKFGSDQFSRFDVYWIQTNRHPSKQTKKKQKKHPGKQTKKNKKTPKQANKKTKRHPGKQSIYRYNKNV